MSRPPDRTDRPVNTYDHAAEPEDTADVGNRPRRWRYCRRCGGTIIQMERNQLIFWQHRARRST